MSRSRTRSRTNNRKNSATRFERLELRTMMASDLIWNNPYWDSGIQDSSGKFSVAQFRAGNENVNLDISTNRFVIGKQNDGLLPDTLRVVRNLTTNEQVVESSVPVTPEFVASIGSIPGIRYTAPVFVNPSTDSEVVVLDEVIVALKPGQSAEEFFGSLAQFSSYRPVDGTPDQYIGKVKNGIGRVALDVANETAKNPMVEWVAPNFYQDWKKLFTPNDPRLASAWQIQNIGQAGGKFDADTDLTEAWNVNAGGSSNIVVAILDDGIDLAHPDLNVWRNTAEVNLDGIDNDGNGWTDDIQGWNFAMDSKETEPRNNDKHGTAVAGLAAAIGDNSVGVAGAAYNSKVMSIKIFDDTFVASDANIASAIYYAAGRTKNGLGTWKSADVIDMSFGSGVVSTAINNALVWATTNGRQGKGVPVFVAAGNSNSNTITEPAAQSPNIPGVFAVGASNNFGNRASYSNYGPGLDFVAPGGDVYPANLPLDTTDRVGAPGFAAPDLVAGLTGDYTGLATTGYTGTSAAAGLSAGIGALIYAQADSLGITLSPKDLRLVLRNSTELIGGAIYDVNTGKNLEYGYGQVNAAAAISALNRNEISIVDEVHELVNRESVGFANVGVGQFSDRFFRIRNQGTTPLVIGNIDVSPAGGPFSFQTIGPKTLNIGESTVVSFRFRPTSVGNFSGKAIIHSDDADEFEYELNFFGTAVPSSVSGTVFEDYNGNGLFESFEGFVNEPGSMVYIDANDNNIREPGEFAVPIVNGGYTIDNLAAGSYIVRSDVPGWTVTYPEKNRSFVVLGSQSITGINFGMSKNYRAYTNVYEEINKDNVRNPNEPALQGVAVSGVHQYLVSKDYQGGLPIPTTGTTGTVVSEMDLDVPQGTVVDVKVNLYLTHTWDSDLTITLTAPNGVTVLLAQQVGGSGDNFGGIVNQATVYTVFDDTAAGSIASGAAPFTGKFRPQQPLSVLQGLEIRGKWKLTISDTKSFDVGLLHSWQLDFQRRFYGISDKNGWALVDLPGPPIFNYTGPYAVKAELQPNWEYSNPSSGTYFMFGPTPTYDKVYGLFYGNVAPTQESLFDGVVPEKQPIGTIVGRLSSIDPNRFDTTFTYSLVPAPANTVANDNAQFRIVGDLLQTNATFDFKTRSVYLVRIRTTDTGGKFLERDFVVNVLPLNIDENKPIGSIAGKIASDPNVGSLVTGTGSADNGAFTVSGSTLLSARSFDFETKNAYAIRVSIGDGAGRIIEKALTVRINDVNEPSTNIDLSNDTIPENSGVNFFVGQFSNNDPDAGDTFTYALVNGAGSSGNSSFKIVGNRLLTNEDFNYEVKNVYPIRVQVKDRGGLTFEKQFTIRISNVNEPPTTIDLSGDQLPENQDAGYFIGIFSHNDPDFGDTIKFELTGTGNDNDLFRIVNDRLESAVTLDHELKPFFTIDVTATDFGGLSTQRSFNIFVTDLPENSFDIVLNPAEVLENQPANTLVGDLFAFDHDVGDSYTLSLVSGPGDDNNGSFTIVGTTLTTNESFNFEAKRFYTIRVQAVDSTNLTFDKILQVSVRNENELPLSILLTPPSVNESLPVGSLVGTLTTTDTDAGDTYTYRFVNDVNFPDNAFFRIENDQLKTNAVFDFDIKKTYSLKMISTDQGGLSVTQVVNVTINNVNDPPTEINITNLTIPENQPVDSLVGRLSTIDSDDSDTFTYTLVNGTGAVDNSNFKIVGNELRTNRVLDFEFKKSHSVRVESRDSGGLTIQKVFVIDVTNVNETPTSLLLSKNNITENSAVNSLVGVFSTTDPDAGESFTYTFATGAGSTDNGKFKLVDNALRTNTPLDFESNPTYSIRVRTTDRLGLSFESAFTINVTDINEAPFNFNITTNLLENTAIGATVGTASASDVDANDALKFALITGIGGEDNNNFSLSQTGELKLLQPVDFETKKTYNILARVQDKAGLLLDMAFVLSVIDVNEAPSSVALSNNSVPENSGIGAVVGNLTTVDQDAGDSFVYSFVIGTGSDDNSSFTIAGNQIKANANFDFETKKSFLVRVKSTDSGLLTREQQLTIVVSDVNEAPTLVSLDNLTIAENKPANSTVGLFSTTDVDANESFTYSLVSGTGSNDNPSFAIVNNRLVSKMPFDFETKSSYQIRVRSTDHDGLTTENGFVIQVQNANDLPENVSLSNQSVDENATSSVVIGLLGATDQDVGDSISFRFVSGKNDNSNFELGGANNNELRLPSALNFEQKSSYVVEIQAIDQSLSGTTKTFTITVNDVNDPVTNVAISKSQIDENVAANSTVGLLSATDEDTSDLHTFTLVTGFGSTDNGKFTIEGNQLKLADSPNFESKSSYSILIQGQDSAGSTFQRNLTISVNDLPETPTDLTLSNSRIRENSASNAQIGTLGAIDPDIGSLLTYALVAGAGSTDNASFAIVGNRLNAKSSYNFESNSSYQIRVRATDQTNRFVENTFTISIDDVNEAPTGIGITSSSIDENKPAGSTVGVFNTVDPDLGETFTYSLVPTATTGDNAKFEIVGNELRAKENFNFEAKASYQLTIRSQDSKNASFEIPLTVRVNDILEVPPVANDESAKTPADVNVIIDVLANDTSTDSNIDPSTVTIVSPPLEGTLRVLPNGRIEYSPPVGRRLNTSFSYTVKNLNDVVSNVANVSVTVYSAFQNQLMKLDVDADGDITPLDVLTIINDINANGFRTLPTGVPASAPYLDANGNGETDPLDALEIVNYINENLPGSGEGESRQRAVHPVDQIFGTMPDMIIGTRKTKSDDNTTMLAIDEYYRDLETRKNRRR